MTEYQLAVADHMKTAPEELKRYVCRRLTDDSWWEEESDSIIDKDPITNCGFEWDASEEMFDFWYNVSLQEWESAMVSDFWKYYITTKHPQQDTLTPISEMEIGQVFAFGTGRWKIVSVENGQAQCERLPDVITLPITQQVPAE